MKRSEPLRKPTTISENLLRGLDNLTGPLPRRTTEKRIRHEYKYLISRADYLRYRAVCERFMPLDEHAGSDGSYFINSLYLDSIGLKDYFDKENGAFDRKKMRIRNYGYDLNWAQLEMKRKIDVWEYKDTVKLTKQQANTVANGDFSCLLERNDDVAVQFYATLSEGLYRPSSIVAYDRVAFALPFEDVRITFDLDVRYSNSNFDLFEPKVLTPLFPDGFVVMEIKYNERLPRWTKRMMADVRKSTESVSKYCFSKMNYL